MSEHHDSPVGLGPLLERLRGGDHSACRELLARANEALEHLARKMLHKFPAVAPWCEATDVCQDAAIRLLRALEDVTPASEQEFFALAGEETHRVLLNRATKYAGAQWQTTHATCPLRPNRESSPKSPVADRADDDLTWWSHFHQVVEKLRGLEGEVFRLHYYNDWTEAAMAELFHVSVRTIGERLHSARAKLR